MRERGTQEARTRLREVLGSTTIATGAREPTPQFGNSHRAPMRLREPRLAGFERTRKPGRVAGEEVAYRTVKEEKGHRGEASGDAREPDACALEPVR